jgi:CheY-like chemotaxis protein
MYPLNGDGLEVGLTGTILARVVSKRGVSRSSSDPPPGHDDPARSGVHEARRRPLVLVVDDHSDTRDLISEYLRFVGALAGAADAIAILRTLRPDVVLTDFAMPGEDGLALLHTMRDDPRWDAIPRILTTGHGETLDLATAAREVGALFLPKPFSLHELAAAIDQASCRMQIDQADREP